LSLFFDKSISRLSVKSLKPKNNFVLNKYFVILTVAATFTLIYNSVRIKKNNLLNFLVKIGAASIVLNKKKIIVFTYQMNEIISIKKGFCFFNIDKLEMFYSINR
jgi:hypothetical protein